MNFFPFSDILGNQYTYFYMMSYNTHLIEVVVILSDSRYAQIIFREKYGFIWKL